MSMMTDNLFEKHQPLKFSQTEEEIGPENLKNLVCTQKINLYVYQLEIVLITKRLNF